MVEPQIVVLVVAGSSPVGHRAYEVLNPKAQTPNNHFIWRLEPGIWDFKLVPVAQPDRASDFGSEGWGFKSLQARHFRQFVAIMSPFSLPSQNLVNRTSATQQGSATRFNLPRKLQSRRGGSL